MSSSCVYTVREYTSGELVQPGVYIDMDSGAIIEVHVADELPEGSKIVEYKRRFRMVTSETKERGLAAA